MSSKPDKWRRIALEETSSREEADTFYNNVVQDVCEKSRIFLLKRFSPTESDHILKKLKQKWSSLLIESGVAIETDEDVKARKQKEEQEIASRLKRANTTKLSGLSGQFGKPSLHMNISKPFSKKPSVLSRKRKDDVIRKATTCSQVVIKSDEKLSSKRPRLEQEDTLDKSDETHISDKRIDTTSSLKSLLGSGTIEDGVEGGEYEEIDSILAVLNRECSAEVNNPYSATSSSISSSLPLTPTTAAISHGMLEDDSDDETSVATTTTTTTTTAAAAISHGMLEDDSDDEAAVATTTTAAAISHGMLEDDSDDETAVATTTTTAAATSHGMLRDDNDDKNSVPRMNSTSHEEEYDSDDDFDEDPELDYLVSKRKGKEVQQSPATDFIIADGVKVLQGDFDWKIILRSGCARLNGREYRVKDWVVNAEWAPKADTDI